MNFGRRLNEAYMALRRDCALATAADARYAPYLLNTLASMRRRFPQHPDVEVFDLGLSRSQRWELARVPWIRVRPVEAYVAHWRRNWSWKPWLLTKVEARFVLYFDSANFVILRPLEAWFLAARRHGYFVVANGQRMRDITPSDYWARFGLDAGLHQAGRTFGAGLFAFDRASAAGDAVREAFDRTCEGLTLGCSAQEESRVFDRSVQRDCPCFRADQTVLNLAFRKHLGPSLLVRDQRRLTGLGGADDHPRQYVWYARRARHSLIHYWEPIHRASPVHWLNRVASLPEVRLRPHGARVVQWWRSARRWGSR
jgi:hypothetical protein